MYFRCVDTSLQCGQIPCGLLGILQLFSAGWHWERTGISGTNETVTVMLNLPAHFPLNIFDNQRGICISRRPVRTNDGNELHLLIAKRPSTRAFLCLSASWIRRLTYVRISTSFGIYPVWAARGHLWFYLILSLVVLTIVRPRSVRLVPCVSTTEPNPTEPYNYFQFASNVETVPFFDMSSSSRYDRDEASHENARYSLSPSRPRTLHISRLLRRSIYGQMMILAISGGFTTIR